MSGEEDFFDLLVEHVEEMIGATVAETRWVEKDRKALYKIRSLLTTLDRALCHADNYQRYLRLSLDGRCEEEIKAGMSSSKEDAKQTLEYAKNIVEHIRHGSV